MSTYYLLDTNALAALRPEQRASSFVKSRCRISAEVLHEAEGYPDHRALTSLAYPVNPGVLTRRGAHQRSVVRSAGPRRPVSGPGNADVILLATVLHEREQATSYLFRDEWIVVTRDRRLCAVADKLDIATLAPRDFARLIR